MRIRFGGLRPCLGSIRTFVAAIVLVSCLIIGLSMLPNIVHATAISDNFNRANGPLGSNWTTLSGTSAPAISGNQLTAGTPNTVNAAYWSANSFNDDQYVQAQFTTPEVSGKYGPGIAVRMSASGHGYVLWYGNTDSTVTIFRMDAPNNLVTLKQSAALTISTTDTWRLEAVGGYLSAYQNGNLIIQTIDDHYTSGSPGVWMFNATNDLDNWAGGDTTPQYSVGGTISGLNGTVTLQTAGETNLSISNDGQFAFNQALADNSTYAVTVATQPTGQICSIQNSTGTVSGSDITNIAVTCTGNPPNVTGSDNFNRADGPLGSSWSNAADGALSISSQAVLGASAGTTSGDIRTAESYSGDQFAQIDVGSVSGADWVGPAVRASSDGQNLYLGLYDYNNGTPYVQIFRRQAGTWAGISATYSCGVLAPGTHLKLEAVGSAVALLINGVERASITDTTVTAGAPGIMAFGVPTADNFQAGNQGLEVHYLSTDANGVDTYDVLSPMNNHGPQLIKVLKPTTPTPGVPHNIIYALPVTAGTDTSFGDGLATLQALNAQNQYNLTIVEPLFGVEPWYADNPNDPYARQESYMTSELVPWVNANLRTSGNEQNWLIGFSKSGLGGMDLFLKHSDIFSLVASWDWPADDSSYSDYGVSSENSYGTDANFQSNYRLNLSFIEAHKTPLMAHPRIWIGGYANFLNDVTDFGNALTGLSIPHLTETPTSTVHRWDSGWVPSALAALAQTSPALYPPNPAPTPTPMPASTSSVTSSALHASSTATEAPTSTVPPEPSPSIASPQSPSTRLSPSASLPKPTMTQRTGFLGISAFAWEISMLVVLGSTGLVVLYNRFRAK
jgi:hypothetical protein